MMKILFNPLALFQENKLFIFGIIATFIGSTIGLLTNSRFDGVLDCHLAGDFMPWYQPYLDNLVNIVMTFAILFALSKMVNKKSRSIDILNAVLISRIPIYLVSLVLMNDFMTAPLKKLAENPFELNLSLSISEWFLIIFSSCFSLLCLIWSITLLFNGFKTASNCKGFKPIIFFAAAILIAEIVSKIFVSFY